MARKRMIDPDFWNDEKLGNCKRDERLLFMGLISNADDEGYGRANVKLLKSTIFPYDDDLKSKDIEVMIISLSRKKLVYVYVVDGQEFYYLPNFLKHQVINKPTDSKLPKMPENQEELQLPEYYGSTTGELPPNRKEDKRKEDKYSDEFENFYSEYPRPEDKNRSYTNWKTCLKDNTAEELITACRNYKAKMVSLGTELKFIKSSANFLGKEKPFRDYIKASIPDRLAGMKT